MKINRTRRNILSGTALFVTLFVLFGLTFTAVTGRIHHYPACNFQNCPVA